MSASTAASTCSNRALGCRIRPPKEIPWCDHRVSKPSERCRRSRNPALSPTPGPRDARFNRPSKDPEPVARPRARRGLLEEALRRISGDSTEFEFRTNEDLVCGIELHTPSCRLAWSVRESVAELESQLIDAIDRVIPTDGMVDGSKSTGDEVASPDREQITQ